MATAKKAAGTKGAGRKTPVKKGAKAAGARAAKSAGTKAPATKAPAKKASAQGSSARKAPAKKAAAKKAPTKQAAGSAGAVKAPGKKAAAKGVTGQKRPSLQRGKDPRGGLNAEGRKYYKDKEGLNLRPGVQGKADTPEKMLRKGSFLRRHFVHPQGPVKDAKGQPTRQALEAAAWGEPVPQNLADERKLAAKGKELLEQYHAAKDAKAGKATGGARSGKGGAAKGSGSAAAAAKKAAGGAKGR